MQIIAPQISLNMCAVLSKDCSRPEMCGSFEIQFISISVVFFYIQAGLSLLKFRFHNPQSHDILVLNDASNASPLSLVRFAAARIRKERK